jgi:hypothetical protein
LTLLSPIPQTVSTGIISAFTYACTLYLHYIHSPTPFAFHLPTPTDATLLFSDFVEEKREERKRQT